MATTDRPVVLIAGGSGSVGSAIAEEAAAQGWNVVVHGRTETKVAAVAERLGGQAATLVRDVAGDEAAGSIVGQAVACFGRLDAVIDCVSNGPTNGSVTGLFKDTNPAVYGAFCDLSVAWLQRLAHAAYPHLAQRGGTLIAFVSDAALFAAPRQSIVGAARAATVGFIRNLAREAGRDGIRAHCISPSYVAQSAVALRMGAERMATAEKRAGLGLPTARDIAPMAMFLCGPGAAKITGQVISINGGLNA
ncbi:MAG TPA: SDR family oxidoreductase [Novosphingobium sp.]